MISKVNEIVLQKDLTTDDVFYKIRDMMYFRENIQPLEWHMTLDKIRQSLERMQSIKYEIQLAFLYYETNS